MTVFALIGANALFLLYAWMLSAIAASYLSGRKGYGDKAGLASGLILFVLGPIVWLVWPAKAHSKWKTLGPFGRGEGRSKPAPAADDASERAAEPAGSRAAG